MKAKRKAQPRYHFVELERATVEERVRWSAIARDKSRPAEERLAALRQLGEALGAFDHAGQPRDDEED